MTKPYREQVLAQLADGEWHSGEELAHPTFPEQGLDAFIRILRAEGYAIEESGGEHGRQYRLLDRPDAG